MKTFRYVRLTLAILVAFMLALPVSATETNLSAARSIDTTFDLDFAESTNWTIDFDNEAGWFHFNHKYVDVFYESYANAVSVPSVTVKLQELVDGSYETVETKYLSSVGNTTTFELPNGGTLTSYRLRFSNTTEAICTFSVMSYR